MSISSPGLGSGLDISGLVSQLVAAEGSAKSSRFDQNEADFLAEITAYGSLKGALAGFQTALSGLSSLDSYQQRSATSSDVEIFTASANTEADESSYGIEVVQLAQANKLITQDGLFTASSDTVGSGTLRITQGVESFSLTIAATDSLETIRDAINTAADNTGITAGLINVDDGLGGTQTKLVFTATDTGLENAITIEVDEDGNGQFNDVADLDVTGLSVFINANLDEPRIAKDGQIRVDDQLVSSENNTFSGVIDGVTITALEIGAGESLSVGLNKSAVQGQVESFVSSYNSLINTINELSFFSPESGNAGVLLGDSTLRNVQSSIRREISSQVPGLTGAFSSLAEIGITTSEDGTLNIDSERFDDVLNNNFDELGGIFASENGLATTLDSILESYAGTSGIIDTKTDGLQISIDDINDQREALEIRLDALQTRLLKQFSALDTLVSSLQNTSDFLTQQLGNLPGAFDPDSRNS